MRRRNVVIIAILIAAAGITTAMLLLRRARAPHAARLLPAADAYFYVDLVPLRTAGVFKESPVEFDAEYAQFVRDSGFQFERDLDEAAFAVHLASQEPRFARTGETRYSEVFVGRFDDAKLADYLRKTAAFSQTYRGSTIYGIPLPGRTVRVAILDKVTVAASNAETDLPIHQIIDNAKKTLDRRAPELVRRYYKHVPLATIAWAIARTAPAGEAGNARYVLPGGFDLFFPSDTVIVGALRYLGSVELVLSAFTRNAEDAQRVTDQFSAFLTVARAVETRATSGDPDLKTFFESISVNQYPDHAELKATVPQDFVKKIMTEPPIESIGPARAKPEDKQSSTEKKAEPRRPAAKAKR